MNKNIFVACDINNISKAKKIIRLERVSFIE